MFVPDRCPNTDCPRHLDPGGDTPFYVRRGYYHTKCRAHPIPRFRCETCGVGFSRQTFRIDYRDHRPDLNSMLFLLLASGLGLRQSARVLSLSRTCTALKFRKIARHLGHLNSNLRSPFEQIAKLQFDELETYEGRRNTRPLTLPMLIERDSRFIIDARCAPIRPRGKMSEARLRAISEDEQRFGPRADESREAVTKVLAAGAVLCGEVASIVLQTDEKSTYLGLAKAAFCPERLVHETTNSRLARGTWNPLFPINHTEAMVRDLMGRLRRDSWLVSKRGWCLDLHLQLFMAYRNYLRPRFNFDRQTPAQILGFVDRTLRPGQLLSWRQDWGSRSRHPAAA